MRNRPSPPDLVAAITVHRSNRNPCRCRPIRMPTSISSSMRTNSRSICSKHPRVKIQDDTILERAEIMPSRSSIPMVMATIKAPGDNNPYTNPRTYTKESIWSIEQQVMAVKQVLFGWSWLYDGIAFCGIDEERSDIWRRLVLLWMMMIEWVSINLVFSRCM